jgi:hypothetical protein
MGSAPVASNSLSYESVSPEASVTVRRHPGKERQPPVGRRWHVIAAHGRTVDAQPTFHRAAYADSARASTL